MTPLTAHALYALAWLSFGAVHTLLAGGGVKARLAPLLGPYYRLAYNALAILHVAAVWLFGAWLLADAPSFALPGWARAGLASLSVLGLAVMLFALRAYDLGRFAGTAQIRNRRRGIDAPEDEPLHTGGMHAFVRHPLYAGGYLILWGAAQDPLGLATAAWGSAYLAAGTWFEERRLLRLYGEAYGRYRARVPALVPWRGRAA